MMLELYKKMYAMLVSNVDQSISTLTSIASQGNYDKQRILAVAENLRRALLDAEDMYLSANEENT